MDCVVLSSSVPFACPFTPSPRFGSFSKLGVSCGLRFIKCWVVPLCILHLFAVDIAGIGGKLVKPALNDRGPGMCFLRKPCAVCFHCMLSTPCLDAGLDRPSAAGGRRREQPQTYIHGREHAYSFLLALHRDPKNAYSEPKTGQARVTITSNNQDKNKEEKA